MLIDWILSRRALPLHNASPRFQLWDQRVGGHYHHCADFHRPITAHVVRFRNRHMTSKGTSCVSASQVPAKKLLISRTLTIIVWTTNPLTAILSCLVRAILKRSSQWFCTLSSTNTANLQRKRFEIERIRNFIWWKINPFLTSACKNIATTKSKNIRRVDM
jgi:hypothetical protein